MFSYVLLALAVLVVLSYASSRLGKASPQKVRDLVQGGARLVDVRTPGEFAAGHLPGALNVPLQDLSARLQRLEPRDRPVVVYCHSGARSGQAASMLKRAGFTDVHDLGAMSRW